MSDTNQSSRKLREHHERKMSKYLHLGISTLNYRKSKIKKNSEKRKRKKKNTVPIGEQR